MKPKAPKFCCNVEQIAVALGHRIPKQTNRRAALLARVRTWMKNTQLPAGCPPFPERLAANGYWPRKQVEALRQWLGPDAARPARPGARSVRPASRRGEAASPPPPALAEAELPPQPVPAGEGDLFSLTPDQIREANKQRLQRNLLIHLGKLPSPQPLRVMEINELVAAGLIPKVETEVLGPTEGDAEPARLLGGGVRGVANFIRQNFPWVACDHMTVQRWKRGEYLPAGCTENFPPPDEAGRWERAAVEDWVRRYLPANPVGQALPLNIVAERDQAELERIEHDRWLRQQERAAADKNYIRVDEMLAYADEIGRAVFRAPYRFEKDLVRLFAERPELAAMPEAERERLVGAMRDLVPGAMEKLCGEMQAAVQSILQRMQEEAANHVPAET